MSGKPDETPADDAEQAGGERREKSPEQRRPDHAQGRTPEEDTRERKVDGSHVTLAREREQSHGGANTKLYKS